MSQYPPTRLQARDFATKIAENNHMTLDDVTGPSRHAPVVRVRWTIIRALHRQGMSLSAIARLMNRHHTSILHALRKTQ